MARRHARQVQALQRLLGELSLSVNEQAAVKEAVRQSLETVREGTWSRRIKISTGRECSR